MAPRRSVQSTRTTPSWRTSRHRSSRTAGERSSGRRTAFRILAAVFALGAFLGLFGIAVLIGWFSNDDGGIRRVHYVAGFGITYGVLVTIGLVAQLWPRPERRVAALQAVAAVALGTLIGGVVSGEAGTAVGFFAAIVVPFGILAALHPDRGRLLSLSGSFSPALGALTVVAAVPLVRFALSMARLQRNGLPIDPHVKNDHWALMAIMAFSVLLVAALASLGTPGWRIPAWSAGAAGVVYGVASLVYPRYPGAEGTGWGIAALLYGLVFIAAAEWEARRRPATPAAPPSAAAPAPA